MLNTTIEKKTIISSSGYCSACNTRHSLPQGNAKEKAGALFRELELKKTVNIFKPIQEQDNQLSTEILFGEERGKMFGVLECLNEKGRVTWLYAFSGQYSARWLIEGWAPPLFDLSSFKSLHDPIEKKIKQISREIDEIYLDTDKKKTLQKKRRQMSRDLMRDIHDLYRVTNFHGSTKTLGQAFLNTGGKPTGTGDCCAPKLLNQAAISNLAPLSLAEFFFGRSNRSATRQHGHFYHSCNDKCLPLLGFMLCGAENRRQNFENKN